MIILSIILSVMLVLATIAALPVSGIYMYIFEHNEWKMWRFFWNNLSNFKYVGHYIDAHCFTLEDYYAYVWSNGCASIHNKTEGCVCGEFWYTKSKRFGTKLMKLKEEGGVNMREIDFNKDSDEG